MIFHGHHGTWKQVDREYKHLFKLTYPCAINRAILFPLLIWAKQATKQEHETTVKLSNSTFSLPKMLLDLAGFTESITKD